MLISPDHFKTNYTLRFDFKVSNNEARYEALIAGLDLARELVVEVIEVFSDPILIVNQVIGEFQVKEERMVKYLKKAKGLLDQFRKHVVTQIPRSENNESDALARLASGIDTEGLVSVPVEHLHQPSIERTEQVFCYEKVKT